MLSPSDISPRRPIQQLVWPTSLECPFLDTTRRAERQVQKVILNSTPEFSTFFQNNLKTRQKSESSNFFLLDFILMKLVNPRELSIYNSLLKY